MKKINSILHVVPSMDPKLGGPPDGIRTLINSFNKIGVKSGLAVIDCPSSPWLDDIDAEIIAVKGIGKYKFSVKFIINLNEFAKKFDIIIIHGVWQFHSLSASIVCLRNKKPYFQYVHGALDKWFKKEYKIKHIKKLLYFKFIEKKILENSNGVLYTSSGEILAQDKSFLIDSSKIFNVGFGKIKPKLRQIPSREKINQLFPQLKNKKIILFLSRLHRKKGIDIYINAIKKINRQRPQLYKNYHFLIVGPEGDIKFTNEEIKKDTLSHLVTRINWIDEDLKWSLMKNSEIFCLPSYSENWGAVVVESLMLGTPVIISNRVNISPLIDKYKCGLICEANTSSFLKSLYSWIDLSQNEKFEYIGNTQKCFEINFNCNLQIKKLTETFENIF